MGRRKTPHAKASEPDDETSTSRCLRQINHCNATKKEHHSTNSKNDPGSNTDAEAGVKDANDNVDFTTCASKEKLTMQLGMEDATVVSAPVTRSESNRRKDDVDCRVTPVAFDGSDTEASADLAADSARRIAPSSSSSSCAVVVKKTRGRIRVVRRRGRMASSLQSSRPSSAADQVSSESSAPSPCSVDQPSGVSYQAAGTSGSNGPFLCPSCNMVIESQSEYTRHIRQHNTVEASSATHSCSLCGKILSSASSLDRHMLVHSGERPFKCRICGMAFTTNGNMHRHMRTHHDGAAVHSDRRSPSTTAASEDETPVAPFGSRNSRTTVHRKKPAPSHACEVTARGSERKAVAVPVENGSAFGGRGRGSESKPVADDVPDLPEDDLLGDDPDDDWDDVDDEPAVEFGNTLLISPVVYSPGKRRKCSDGRQSRPEKLDGGPKGHHDDNNNSNKCNNNDPSNNWLNGGAVCAEMDESLHCAICGKSFLYKTGLLKHLDGHMPSEFRCKDCRDSKVFPNYQALLKHRAAAHGHATVDKQLLTRGDGVALQPTAVGFHDLTFIDFSASKFTLIAKSACERSLRYPSSEYHIFQCRQCSKAFPSTGSLKMHARSAHSPLIDTKPLNHVDAKRGRTPRGHGSTSTCVQCHAAFASHHQLQLHCLRHQAAEYCATPYSVVKGSAGVDPTPADLAPLLNKENFLALLELQSKTKDDDGDSVHAAKRMRLTINGQQGAGLGSGGDFADIQSILAVTSTASIIPSMATGSSPIATRNGGSSPLPPEATSSPRRADSVTASPELPSEHNNNNNNSNNNNNVGLSMMNSAALLSLPKGIHGHDSPSTSASSLTSSPPSSENSSPAKYAGLSPNQQGVDCGRARGRFACNQCQQVLPNLRALKAHNRIHLGGSPFNCNVCPYSSIDKSTLMRHLRTHNGERPYMCTLCQYAFTTKANCERHLRTKHERRNKADVRDAMRYVALDVREEEMAQAATDAAASSDAANACPHCNLQFVHVRLLKQHLQGQHGDLYANHPPSCHEWDLSPSHGSCLRHISKQHLQSAEGAVGRSASTSVVPTPHAMEGSGGRQSSSSVSAIEPAAHQEPARSHSADEVMSVSSETLPPDPTAGSSTTALDLSGTACYSAFRPASCPGASPPSLFAIRTASATAECPTSASCDEPPSHISNLDSLINVTVPHDQVYDAPPQEQPLDLALYPMDLSMTATSSGYVPSATAPLASGPMDLSAPSRQPTTVPATPPSSIQPQPSPSLAASADRRMPYTSLPSPFQSRPPPPRLLQTPRQPVPVYSMPPQTPLQMTPTTFLGSARPRLSLPNVYVTPVSNNLEEPQVQAAVHPPPPLPMNDPSLAALTMVSALASARPHVSPSGPRLHSSPPPPPPQPPVPSLSKSEPNVAHGKGKTPANGANGHGRGVQLNTSANSFLLKKQKQRRYRTERPFKCSHCAAGFTLRSNMERHIKQQHPEFWASKARSRKLPSSGSGPAVTAPSVSITPITSLASSGITVAPSLLHSVTQGFHDVIHFATLPDRLTAQHLPQKPLLQPIQPKTDAIVKATISSEVKQAISQQIKQRKSLEMVSPVTSVTITPIITVATALPLPPRNSVAAAPAVAVAEVPLVDSVLPLATPPPTIKVTETIFPPALAASQTVDGGGVVVAATSALATPPSVRSSPMLPPAESKAAEDAEDTLADLASVSKLLDTASQQNIQEMFRRGTADDDDGEAPLGQLECEAVCATTPKMTASTDAKSPANDAASDDPSAAAAESVLQITDKSREVRRSAYNTAPNRVACPYCHRLFPWTSSLRRHILTHTGQKPFKCPCCPLWFTTKSNCDRHLLRKHGGNSSGGGGGSSGQLEGVQNAGGGDGTGSVAGSVVLTTCGGSSGGTVTIGAVSPTADCTARNAPDRPYRCNYCLCSTFATVKNLQKHLEAKHAAELGSPSAAHLMPLTPPTDQPTAITQNAGGCTKGAETSVNTDHLDVEMAAKAKSEGGSEAGSNSGSDRCWGESEESGEDALPETAPPLQRFHGAEPLFYCYVCLKSFARREHCLGHLQQEHPDEHGLLAANKMINAGTSNESSGDDVASNRMADKPERKEDSPDSDAAAGQPPAANDDDDDKKGSAAVATDGAAEDVTVRKDAHDSPTEENLPSTSAEPDPGREIKTEAESATASVKSN